MACRTLSFCKTLSKLAKANRKNSFPKGKLINGNVTFKTNDFALIDIGYTQSGILLNNESWFFKNLSVGSTVKVYVEFVNEEGVIVSRRKLDEIELWAKLENLCETGTAVEAKIINFTRKGIKLDVYGIFGAIFWTKELIELEIELRSRSVLVTRIKSICKTYNMVVLTLAHKIKNTIGRTTSPKVWTGLIDLCDKGIWTNVDACNGIIMLSGRPWCNALDLINQLTFGKIILSNFVKLKKAPKPARTGDYIDLLTNFIMEIDDALNWDRNISSITSRCVWEWIISLAASNRNRWCNWRNHDDIVNSSQLNVGQFIKLSEPEFCDELKFELNEVNEKQNLIWDVEQTELLRVLCEFDFKKFKTTLNILNLMCGKQLNFNDKAWYKRINDAWLWETKMVVLVIASWKRTLSAEERERILKYLRNETKTNAWRKELEWENEQNLLDISNDALTGKRLEIDDSKVELPRKRTKGERRQNEVKIANLHFEQLNHHDDDYCCYEDNWNEDSFESEMNCEFPKNEKSETSSPSSDRESELNAEWNEMWHLEREQNYWNKQHIETDCSLIETNCEKCKNVRMLRSVYAIIVGMDVQTTLLVTAITNMLLTYVCDFSLTDDDVKMLQNDWGNSLAIKITPIGLNYSLDDVLVEADMGGYKYLRFAAKHIGLSLTGIIAKFETNDMTIKLTSEICGKLRFNMTTIDLGIEVGMEVDVMITDFNPITNDINLELTEDEVARTILVEI
ncbi:MAG: hypothetical protein ACTS4U_01075 [Candidatus Hodgkinia cicadicola]